MIADVLVALADAFDCLFADPDREKQQRLDAVADAISDKFGKTAIRRGGSLK